MERVLDPRDFGTFGLGCWFRTVAQVEQNAAARELGALSADQMQRIELALGR